MVPDETSRSREAMMDWRLEVDGTRGFANCVGRVSREAELRSRGLTILLCLDACRLSLDGVARRLGTGSLEGRGRPDGLALGECSMVG